MNTILLIDDEKNYLKIMQAILEGEGFETLTAQNGPAALEILKESDIDLVVTDMRMPEMDGIQFLENFKAMEPDIPVIVITAHGTIQKAVEAMQKGAYTYILKPFDNDEFVQHIKNAISVRSVYKENLRLRSEVSNTYSFGKIIGKSAQIRNVFDTILKVAPSAATILIEGESGTGKELVAKSIHYNSPRKNKPFVAVNCSALAESLLENELFGHEKGAFTGAHLLHKGRFEKADGGTIFLDEIGELSQNLQVKLLRVLQEKCIERIGGSKTIRVDFRLIAATNKNLKNEVEGGRFREDLYYRLNVIKSWIPPLRSRKEDIPLLVKHFISKYSKERPDNIRVSDIHHEAQKAMFDYAWPGNIRELENVIERAVILCQDKIIHASDLPPELRQQTTGEDGDLYHIPENCHLSDALTIVEKSMLIKALKKSNGVQAHAARHLGIGKSGLNQKLKKFNITIDSI